MWFALSLSVLVVVYNNLINQWRPFHGAAYVPANLVFTGAISLVAAGGLELSSAEMGLSGDVTDAAVSLGAVALFGIAAFGFARSRHAHLIVDRRVVDLEGGGLAWYVLVRIPLGTAVAEEVVFRGVLFAVWREEVSTLLAAVAASVAFGLWHIAPTILGVRINDPRSSARKLATAVTGAVLLTTIAGMALTWLRLRSGGLIAPIVLHAGINSVSALAAVTARRASDAPRSR